MKELQNIIIIALCTAVLGFFANWAQNDYSFTILSLSMMACAVALFIIGFLIIKPLKVISAIYMFIFSVSVLIPIAYFLKFNLEELILFSFVLLFILVTIFPLVIIFYTHKKGISIDYFNFYLSICTAILCLGNTYCFTDLPGDFLILLLSLLMSLPLLFKAIKQLFKSIKQNEVLELMPALLYLILSLNLFTFVSDIMHWPLAKILVQISFTILGFTIIFLLINLRKRDTIFSIWKSQLWLIKLTTVCLLITSLWYILRLNNLSPALYSSNIPPSKLQLKLNENSFTKDGRINAARLKTYDLNYSRFIQNRKAATTK